jgi:hypothetical protein
MKWYEVLIEVERWVVRQLHGSCNVMRSPAASLAGSWIAGNVIGQTTRLEQ